MSRTCTLLLSLILCAGAAGCGEEGPGEGPPPVLYQGISSDEAYFVLYDKRGDATMAGARGAQLIEPAPDGEVSAGAAPVFRWELASQDSDPTGGCAVADAGLARGGLGPLHCPAFSGYLYWLQLYDGDELVANVITSDKEATIPEDDWSALSGGSGTISGRLYAAFLAMNVVQEGPYLHEFTLTVGEP
jgi:hypothetical protein